ncbi:hypothetical protein BCR41DRAFT_357747 [Lobosporangium transversale]|uniref:Tim17/Tim22/Tim23/Pmp24 family-domain-containing protein n=1 Tax=Lobosporangium transversale TaxID=64571 RepID=A0A1Y2GI41_9FUNG|nr:hypothetical protein BCR41DRAFT_357747 [Lobosporangium transversale]ORZ10314.1 hypothetical protein BCR41DRAFT_357747 [Lobosporangium transversale]|eukprot:XP_021879221.1 hypothetical protein BCR41DRAFT_357747 [Lobosporangium transversale]
MTTSSSTQESTPSSSPPPSSISTHSIPTDTSPAAARTLSPHYYYNTMVVQQPDFSTALSKNPLLTRIGLEPIKRITLITGTAAFWGFILGGVIGSRQAGMQYLAENAHRLPKNMEGWYFYHKRKNYRMAFGALKKGAVYSAKTGVLVGLFEVLEASADFYRGGADFLNSMMAGVISGGIFSAASKEPFLNIYITGISGGRKEKRN